jgi:glucosyl-dolichyl phosphate glucuronosyltransferase
MTDATQTNPIQTPAQRDHLDVLIPTYNRSKSLARTLDSLLTAEQPDQLSVQITVVDNNSTDGTRESVRQYAADFPGRLGYVFEPKQGRSHALNAGISATNGGLVGMIDDDEEVHRHWLQTVSSAFADPHVDFIGGPYLPRWGAQIPRWLPPNYLGVIGWVDGGNRTQRFDEKYPGILMGGNAVIRRSLLNSVGLYSTRLGRNHKRLLSCEDEDMYRRLLAAGAVGMYRPDLIIYHYIPSERLTKRYFRNWCFWRGVSLGVMDRERPLPVVYVAGAPRYLYGQAIRSAVDLGRCLIHPDDWKSFSGELAWWDLAGFLYGKHFYQA